jgi:stress response protein YsnF
MAQTVIGMFDNAAEAQQAVQKLTSKGFSRDNIDVTNGSAGLTDSSAASSSTEEESGISKFFKNLFSDDDDTDKYTHVARRSQSIVTVHAQSSDEAEDAADILDDCGAVNVDERAASYGYAGSGRSGFSADSSTTDFTGTGTTALGAADYTGTPGLNSDRTTGDFVGDTGSTYTNSDINTTNNTTKIPIIEENLEVGKREVVRGGTRLRSRIVERPVEESLRLREETVHVNRNPVDRAATSEDLANFSGREIEMTETAEVPVVNKEARVVEEVSLGKEVSERTETVSDTVRKTEVDIEDLSSDTNRTGYTNTNTNNTSSDL